LVVTDQSAEKKIVVYGWIP